MCDGELRAVEPTTAAGCPAIFTVEMRPPSIMPTNGCGSGVGTSAGPAGTITMWVSVAITWSFAFAAGCPMCAPSIQLDHRSGHLHLGVAGDVHLVRLQREIARYLNRDISVLLEARLGLADLEPDLAVRSA